MSSTRSGPPTPLVVAGNSFFPTLISGPFHQGLEIAFAASAVLCGLAAAFSWWAGNCRPDRRWGPMRRGTRYRRRSLGGTGQRVEAALPEVVEV